MCKVYVLVGLPGSGKSSWANRKVGEPGVVICSADDYFVDLNGTYRFDPSQLSQAHSMCMRKYLQAIQACEPCVIVDNTNTAAIDAAPYIAMAQAYGYRVDVAVFRCTIERSVERNIHKVPREVIEKLAASMEDMLDHWPLRWPEPVYL